jgi:class 3 adenylate cyclase/predicted Ser/Thr protein kinase
MATPPGSGDPPPVDTDQRDRPVGTASVADQPGPTQQVEPSLTSAPLALFGPGQDLPETFGRYKIVRRLAQGGMGAVYLAHDTQLDRAVALKVPHFGPTQGPQTLERFLREARAAALLHHPNICPVYDVGEVGGIPFLTMAYIEGQTLAELVPTFRTLPGRETAALVQSIALALEEAHSHGVLHRDLKPSNIMLNKRREPVVMDFGLARRLQADDQRLTRQGVLLGTPAYMPPEQVNQTTEATGPTGDVYSLGVILYELLTGRTPFQGSLASLLVQIVSAEPEPPSTYRPDLDPALELICLKALAREVNQRFASMAELAAALGAYLRGEPIAGTEPAAKTSRNDLFDLKIAEEVLGLLRTWGSGMGLKKLKGRAQGARDERKRTLYQFFLDWMSGERKGTSAAVEAYGASPLGRALAGWALAGQAMAALRDRAYGAVHRLLDQAAAQGDPEEPVQRATLAHTRGVVHVHQGKTDEALPHLHEALALLGRDHFGTGRVLDTLGMVYASRGNFHVAREFYEEAIRYKERQGDEAGLALSHGQLGRLHLDWGHLDRAEEHFQIDLRLAQKLLDPRGEAQMYNHLGQVALARAERELAAGRKGTARRLLAEAAGWLQSSICLSAEGNRTNIAEAFARKDRALVHLLEGDLTAAEEEVRKAEDLFQAARFGEGLAQVNRVWGALWRAQERYEEAIRKLRAALGYFDDTQDRAEAARVQWEIARTLRAAEAPAPLLTRAYLETLQRAEACRRDALVHDLEKELYEVDHEAYFRHIYRRVRGHDVGDDTPSLLGAAGEVATVLYLQLEGFSDYCRGLEPQEVLMTLNQMMADLAAVLQRHRAQVTSYQGDGFMALLREARHAERSVGAALDLMTALHEFNRPREVLGLPLFRARVVVNTGPVLLGNVGTYHKMDFTVIGATVDLASRLLGAAEAGLPCLSRATYELVQERFVCKADGPRHVNGGGAGACEVWDVVARKEGL